MPQPSGPDETVRCLLDELPAPLQGLVREARAARQRAYAPYSQFQVGAALRVETGELFTGANVENASYGLAVCAERTAVLAAVMAGHRAIAAIAICTELDPPAAPCGMCRQTLAEFARDCEILLCSPSGTSERVTRLWLRQVLPHAFVPETLHAYTRRIQSRPPRKPGS